MKFVFSHHAICSSDLKQSEKFYQDFLGLKKVDGWCNTAPDGSWQIDFYHDGVTAWMLEVKWDAHHCGKYNHGDITSDHIAFGVENVEEARNAALSAGYNSTELDENGNCMITDPDGYQIEVCNCKDVFE